MSSHPRRQSSHQKLRRSGLLRDIKTHFRFIWPYLKPYWFSYLLLFAFVLFGVFMNLFMAWFLKGLTEAATSREVHLVKHFILLGLGVFLLDTVLAFVNSYIRRRITSRLQRDMQMDLFVRVLRAPLMKVTEYRSGDLVSRLTNDINMVISGIVGNILNSVRLPLTAILAFVYLFRLNVELTLICVAFGPLALLAGMLVGRVLRPNAKRIQNQIGFMYSFLGETFVGFRVIRSFALERLFRDKYRDQSESLMKLEIKEVLLRGGFRFAAQLGSAVAFLSVMGVGAYDVAMGSLSIGTLMAFFSLMRNLMSPFGGMASQFSGFQRSLASAERLWKIHGLPTQFAVLPEPRLSSNGLTDIRFEHVNFAYRPSQPVIQGLDLHVPAGSTLALVGPTGSGKSTLVNLVVGFFRPHSGCLYLGERLIESIPADEFSALVSYVAQETYLFSGTIRENIMFGRPNADYNEMIQAAKDASAHGFITSLLDGYDTQVGEGGMALSGGQRQRIAIARALLKNAPILLLDEPTSALDVETEAELRDALERLMEGRTTILVAHRLTTIRKASKIAVLREGRIAEQGSHEELLDANGYYAKMYHVQFMGEYPSEHDYGIEVLGGTSTISKRKV